MGQNSELSTPQVPPFRSIPPVAWVSGAAQASVGLGVGRIPGAVTGGFKTWGHRFRRFPEMGVAPNHPFFNRIFQCKPSFYENMETLISRMLIDTIANMIENMVLMVMVRCEEMAIV